MYYLTFFMGFLFSKVRDKEHVLYYIFLLTLFLLSIFRHGVGPDYFAYQNIYNSVSTNVLVELQVGARVEVGFRILISLSKILFQNYTLFLAFFSGLNLYFIHLSVKRYSNNPTLSLLLYYSFYYFIWIFSGLRQGLALNAGLYILLRLFDDGNEFRFYILTVLLSLIHLSVLVVIPIYLLTKLDFSRKQILIILVLSVLISFLPIQFFVDYLKWVPWMNRVAGYIDPYNGLLAQFDFQSLVRLVFIVVAIFFYDFYVMESQKNRRIMNFYLLSFAFYFIFKFSELSAARLAIYGKYLDIIIFPSLLTVFKLDIDKRIYYSLLIIFSLIFMQKELKTMMSYSTKISSTESIFVPFVHHFNFEEFLITEK